MHNKAPEYLTAQQSKTKLLSTSLRHFALVRDSTAYNLRDSNFNLALQKPNTENLKKRFSYCGGKLWNSLPSAIKAEPSLEVFRKSLFTLGLHDIN